MKNTHLRRLIDRASIKEGFDNLPSGVCFADRNGTIALCNRQMHRLCFDLMGTDVQHIFELRKALDAPQPCVETVDRAAAIYRFPGGKLWRFAETPVTDEDGLSYTQVQAIDVTELHRRSVELRKENAALSEANARARRPYTELDRIVREKETLAMKIRVHDDLGLCLLSTHNLLTQGGTPEDYRRGGERWEQALHLVDIADHSAYAGRAATAAQSLAELEASAGEIGIRISVEGSLPPEEEAACLTVVAMRECATNAVRHAGGSEMTVRLTQTEAEYRAELTNNGRKPQGRIIEGGGLGGLRRAVEDRGGTMTAESEPEFRLTVTLPKKEGSK